MLAYSPLYLPWTSVTLLSVVILVLPFTSFLLNTLVTNRYARQASIASCFFMVLSSFISVVILLDVMKGVPHHSRFIWFSAGTIDFTAGLLAGTAAMLLTVTVNVVSLLVHLYSLVYMRDDEGYKRYYSFLGLFTFSMLGIVLADNLLIIFMFWELVGLSSYLLIGHWYTKEAAARAARKAFIVNRIGDAGFIIGMSVLWMQFQTLDIEMLKVAMGQSYVNDGLWITGLGHTLELKWLTLMGLGLFLGAVGKSAQFPLQVWLPDAMEGPTPVSALIHAATMVAAGVFFMGRVFVLLNVEVLSVIAIIGSITAFMGAVAALAQHDIKKVLAYSTISQLGYMFIGVGTGAMDLALFHLFTHAFFKAALFLAAGSVIFGLHELAHQKKLSFDTQDMRNMGGLRSKMPLTFAIYSISTLALMGVPMFSGFLSKDALLSASVGWAMTLSESGMVWSYIVPILAFLTVALTAFYMIRQVLLVFFGRFRAAEKMEGIMESPMLIKVPLIILAVMSIGFVWSLNPFDYNTSWFLDVISVPDMVTPGVDLAIKFEIVKASGQYHILVSVASVLLVILGGALAWYRFKPNTSYLAEYLSDKASSPMSRLSLNNWYLDEAYQRVIVLPVNLISRSASRVETNVIDRAVNVVGIVNVLIAYIIGWLDRNIIDGIINFSVFFVDKVGVIAKSFQRGKIHGYIILSVLCILLIILLIL
ncbi:NADH-quinone oxidoreductase subunit L [Fulvivirga sp. M361]|uniref:NADH-quinone oxidoreductase subunit L n=1 Tax=Fulvivirga sp. M361 TaxID=2594266 RepID=UPI00117B493A|nr:NADH-quinone oxidoreductase subunit L [Fulvivirga sp. M361]TRX56091.1 NADH-quinone oxidoreductase subunit L [Fulvivirga sp. M361]